MSAPGFWNDMEELTRLYKTDRVFTPQSDIRERYARWAEAVRRSKGWEN